MRIAFLGNFRVDYSSETHHANTLDLLGHHTIRLQEGVARGEDVLTHGMSADMVVVVHTHGWTTPGLPLHHVLQTLNRAGIPTVTYHLDLWFGLHRQRDIETDPFYRNIGWFFTVDKLMADWLSTNTPVKGRFLPAGVYEPECHITGKPSAYANDVVFVGSRNYHPEWTWRPTLIDWLRSTYGERFTHIGPDGDTGTLRGDALNRMYANSKVAVGDTLCLGFNYPSYVSDRYFEACGRGAFQIFPRITGTDWVPDMPRFDFGDFDNLKAHIDHYLHADDEREDLRRRCHQDVKANHTYAHRWQTILDTVTA